MSRQLLLFVIVITAVSIAFYVFRPRYVRVDTLSNNENLNIALRERSKTDTVLAVHFLSDDTPVIIYETTDPVISTE